MKVANHRLQADGSKFTVGFTPSPNKGGAMSPKYLIIHFTAGGGAASSIEWFKNPAAKASAHLVIDRSNGAITQMVDFNTVAWHAGKSKWKTINGLNSCSIGIELDNAGQLTKSGAQFLSWFKKPYPADDVFTATDAKGNATHWHEYSEAQIAALLEAAAALHAAYNFTDILGHSDIAPGRKTDPGPAFPMGSFKAKILGRS
jgi:N-acetylmuramoyl-L-alanine amidase